MKKHGTLRYSFERLFCIVLPGGVMAAPCSGECLVEYDVEGRGFSITQIWIRDEGPYRKGMVELLPDLGYLRGFEGWGGYEQAHAALETDREEEIGRLVDAAIDQEAFPA